eukprot:7975204-Pyramimonas_sp.AAC.1
MSPARRAQSAAFANKWHRVDTQQREETERKGLAFLQLCCDIALHQISCGRDFVLEHPLSASS